MISWLQSYRAKSFQKRRAVSIAKDETVVLAERLEFFAPDFKRVFSRFEAIIYILIWSLFVTVVQLGDITTWADFIIEYMIQVLIITLTVVPTVYLIELQRKGLEQLRLLHACLRMIMTAVSIGALASLITLFMADFLGVIHIAAIDILIETALYALIIAGFNIIILIYLLKRHRELKVLQVSFAQRLKTQNSHMKARLAPHFFFNTINTLASLVETDADNASRLLHHLSHLFRSSFSEPKESNFEEEIELCRHYLAIEHYRLQDKLVVEWILPDEDLMYDMSITSLTLQNVLEQTVLHVVELTTDSVHIRIEAIWENHIVTISVAAEMPKDMFVVHHNIESRLNFHIQESRLRSHFGLSASITTKIDDNSVTNTISYPLRDVII